jgi:ABC-type bacteriocin/lantibiotic exporter with double-glycine peptidase domain
MPRRLGIILCLCGFISATQAAGVWLDVPFIKQEKDGCGAASIAMVMQYWQNQTGNGNAAAEAAEIQRELYSPKAHGIHASAMERYFQQNGFQTFTFAGTWDDLKKHVEKGRPLIAALKPSPGESSLHYVVVVGVDPKQNVVLLNDAAQRKLLKEDRGVFEKEWSAVSRWTLLAVPRSQKQ